MLKSMSLQVDSLDDCMESLDHCIDLDEEEEEDMEMDLFEEG